MIPELRSEYDFWVRGYGLSTRPRSRARGADRDPTAVLAAIAARPIIPPLLFSILQSRTNPVSGTALRNVIRWPTGPRTVAQTPSS